MSLRQSIDIFLVLYLDLQLVVPSVTPPDILFPSFSSPKLSLGVLTHSDFGTAQHTLLVLYKAVGVSWLAFPKLCVVGTTKLHESTLVGSSPGANPAGTCPIHGVGQHVALKVLQGLSTALLRSGAALGSTDLPRGTFPHIQGPGIPFPRLSPPCGGDKKGTSTGPHFLSSAWPALLRCAPSRHSKAHSAAPIAPSQWLLGILVPCLGCAAPGHSFRRGNLPSLGEKTNAGVPGSPGHPRCTGGRRLAGPCPPCRYCPVPFKGESARKFLNGCPRPRPACRPLGQSARVPQGRSRLTGLS